MKFSYRQKLAYAFGMFGVALSYQAFIGWIQFYYLDVLRMAPLAMTAAWVIFTIWNVFNDPIAGQISDRTNTRWGRRIPWILGLSIPIGLSFYLLWVPPNSFVANGGQIWGALWWYFLAVLLLFDTIWSMIAINYTALFPEMYPDQEQRATVSGWRQAFAIVSLVLAVTFTKEIADTIGWGKMGMILGGLTTLAFLISLLGSKERGRRQEEPEVPFRQALRYTYENRSFRWFLLMNLMVEFSLLVLPAVVPLYAKYVLGETDGLRQGLLSGAAFLVAVPSFVLWSWLAKRWGTRKSLIAAILVFGLLLTPLLFVQSFPQAMATTALLGIGLAGLLMLRDILLADVIDEDSLVSEARREGMYFGMNGFVIRAAFAAQGVILGSMLAWANYNPALENQPPDVETGLRVLITFAPILAMGVALFAMYRYPLHGERLAEVKQAMAEV